MSDENSAKSRITQFSTSMYRALYNTLKRNANYVLLYEICDTILTFFRSWLVEEIKNDMNFGDEKQVTCLHAAKRVGNFRNEYIIYK